MNDWWKKCEHGSLVPHDFDNHWQGLSDCPGGSPVTAADLEGLGMLIPWCDRHNEPYQKRNDFCKVTERLLIPIPDPQPATEAQRDGFTADMMARIDYGPAENDDK